MKAFWILAAVAGLSGPALAHAFLTEAHPRAGENAKPTPIKIELHFTEPLEPTFSSIAVTNEAGQDVTASAATANGTEMDVALKPLAPGRYRVTWHAVSVDTHKTQGGFNFTVAP